MVPTEAVFVIGVLGSAHGDRTINHFPISTSSRHLSARQLLVLFSSIVNHLAYDAFRDITSESNSALDFPFGFTARERDEESGLQFNRARYYVLRSEDGLARIH